MELLMYINKRVWFVNRYIISSLYRVTNMYYMWVINRLIIHGFKVYLIGKGISSILRNKRPKEFVICTTATVDNVTTLFKMYEYVNNHVVKVYFTIKYYIRIHSLKQYNCSSIKQHFQIRNILLNKLIVSTKLYYDIHGFSIVDIVNDTSPMDNSSYYTIHLTKKKNHIFFSYFL